MELIVVVAVLGVLAAIAVPTYLSSQDAAEEVSVKADLVNARVALIEYAARHDGDAPAEVTRDGAATGPAGSMDLRGSGWTRGGATADLRYSAIGSSSWCLIAVASSGASFSAGPTSAVLRGTFCS